LYKKYLWWLHVEDLGDAALHDKEVRVVDVELYGAEQILDAVVVGVAAVDQILVTASNHHLQQKSCNYYETSSLLLIFSLCYFFFVVFISDRS
jgi:hypothetical protein